MSAAFLAAAMVATLEFGVRSTYGRRGARAAAANRPAAADVILMRVRQQDDVHVAEPRIRFVSRLPRVVQDADTRRVFEQECPVPSAQLAGMAAKRRHLDECLGVRGTCDENRSEQQRGREVHGRMSHPFCQHGLLLKC